mgnify:CR=1 FL=1
MTVYFGIYAFNNPDEQAYYISGSALNQPELVAVNPADMNGVTEIHDRFVTWFKMGFASCMLMFAMPCVVGLAACASRGNPQVLMGVAGCYYCCMLIYGLVASSSASPGDTTKLVNTHAGIGLVRGRRPGYSFKRTAATSSTSTTSSTTLCSESHAVARSLP